MEGAEKPKQTTKEKRGTKKTDKIVDAAKTDTSGTDKPGRAKKSKKDAAVALAETVGTPPKRARRKKESPTFEQVQLRAYFIAERRAQLGITGDSTSDWVQAERELVEELGAREK
jgi:hypothetical protein